MLNLQGARDVTEDSHDRADDRRLLDRIGAGDDRALQELLRSHSAHLYRLCHAMLGNPEDAEDALQDVFIRAIRGLPSFRRDASLRTWLTRIAVNLCANARRARRPSYIDELPLELAAPRAESPESQAIAWLGVREALGALPPRQRAALLLKELEGLSVDEIATVQGSNRRRIYYELALAYKALAAWRRNHEGGNA